MQAVNPKNFPDLDLVNEHPIAPILHYCQAFEPEYYDKHYVWSKYQINFGIAQRHGGTVTAPRTPRARESAPAATAGRGVTRELPGGVRG